MNASVSAILSESNGIAAQPGAKLDSPFCQDLQHQARRPLGQVLSPRLWTLHHSKSARWPISALLCQRLRGHLPRLSSRASRPEGCPLSKCLQLLGHRAANSPSRFNPGFQPGTPRSLVWYQTTTSLSIQTTGSSIYCSTRSPIATRISGSSRSLCFCGETE
jgi:hypothetical protein